MKFLKLMASCLVLPVMVSACGGGGSSSTPDGSAAAPTAVVALPTVIPPGYPVPRVEPGQVVTGTKFVYLNAMSNSALGSVEALDYSLADVISPRNYVAFKPALKPGDATTIYLSDSICKAGSFSAEIRNGVRMNAQIDEISISCGQTIYCKQTVLTFPGNAVVPTVYMPSPLVHACVVS